MTALQSLISIVGLLVVFLVMFNSYRVDSLRQQLFELRDALFDEAMEGKIAFDSPAYRSTRILLNGLLRFAHRVSIARFFAGLFFVRPQSARSGRFLEKVLAGSSAHDRTLCLGYIARANVLLARHMMFSPIAFPLLLPVLSLALTWFGVSLAAEAVKRMTNGFRLLDRVAYAEGLA